MNIKIIQELVAIAALIALLILYYKIQYLYSSYASWLIVLLISFMIASILLFLKERLDK